MKDIEKLLEVMRRLRDPQDGCPWDQAQTFASVAPYTIEEAYEVADAIDKEDTESLQEELGDLLFQVVFHSQMATEEGKFGFADVANSITEKLICRHPHVFDGGKARDVDQQSRQWEEHKAGERAEKGDGTALGGVPLALPALSRAEKLGDRAAAVGFDWPNRHGPRDKIDEELAELDDEIANGTEIRTREELGDLLFAVVNLARHLKIDAEDALRATNQRFEDRFRLMERIISDSGGKIDQMGIDELESVRIKAKNFTKSPPNPLKSKG